MDRTYEDIYTDIFNQSVTVLDTNFAELYIKSNEDGIVPIDTGETQKTTELNVKAEGEKITAEIKITTDYAKYPYYKGNKTGIKEWLEETALDIRTDEKVQEGLKL